MRPDISSDQIMQIHWRVKGVRASPHGQKILNFLPPPPPPLEDIQEPNWHGTDNWSIGQANQSG